MKWIPLFVFLSALFSFTNAWADSAMTINPGAIVYVKPDFDTEHMAELDSGVKIEVSKRAFGPFHRVRLPDGKIGFIADNDYQLTQNKTAKNPKAKKTDDNQGKLTPLSAPEKEEEKKPEASAVEPEKKPKKNLPFTRTRYRGLSISYLGYQEQTMGGTPMANSVFYGFKMFGPGLIVDGAMVTELNVDVLPNAPAFYQEATGKSASGFLLHTDLLFDSLQAHGKDGSTFFGFGPMFKYDNYSVSLPKGSSYDLTDFIFGVVFEAGAGIRLGPVSLRAELKYDWEKTQYWGFGGSLLFPF
jgi:hypothetical protein